MRLFYASDIHGSDTCWRKFLNAAGVYRAEVLVMGGDVTGKGIVPIVEVGQDAWRASFKGKQLNIATPEALSELRANIGFNGMYPYICTEAELTRLATAEESQEAVFDEVMLATFGEWLALARTRLAESGIRCFVMPGNDDTWIIDEAFDGTDDVVVNCDRKVLDVGEGYTMLSLGYANPTPWDSPREAPEEQLEAWIDEMANEIPDMSKGIFNLHVPPYASELDMAPALDDFRTRQSGGQMVMEPVGSVAVRRAIERHQPALALHGHIHESKGAKRIGRTLCINPGSSYSLGQLDGVIVELGRHGVKRHQLITG